MSVKVRFAPSPTGPLHIGGLRTALYNYLFAKANNGTMVLRIEDTDQARLVPGAEKYLQDALQWANIELDESPEKGGKNAPYRQSERKDIYKKYVQQLIDEDKAYYAFDTQEEIEEMRKRLEEMNSDNPSYNSFSRQQMKNSLTLPKEEVEQRINSGDPYVVRLKVPIKEEIRFKDLIRGPIVVHSSTIDDKVLLKSDGMPTYHLANIVDDHLMEITHVIRGEEWLPSAPLHILLYQAFGWEPPQFAHLPLILKPEGNGKLSKRDGILGDFPVFPLEYTDPETKEISRGFKEDGYLPEALINFLALLGWNPGTDQEIFSLDELINSFSLDQINKSGARFDVQKAKWFNQQYLKNLDNSEIAKRIQNENIDEKLSLQLVDLMKDRVTFIEEITSEVPFLFEAPQTYDQAIVEKKWNQEVKDTLPLVIEEIQSVPDNDFTPEKIHDAIFNGLESKGIKAGKIMQALRLAITGLGNGPDLMKIIAILGKQETIDRINKALNTL